MYKSAIIGLGEIGYKMDQDPFRKLIWSHSKAYIKHEKLKLIAVSDLDKENYYNFNKIYPNISFYNNFKKMIKLHDLDIISICTPTFTHLNIVNDIIKIKPPKAIFIEKPAGLDLTSANKIVNLCNDNNVLLAVNYMRRWDNKFIYIKNIIDKKELGDLQTITAYGSTALLTSTSHLLDLFLHYGGNIDWMIGDLQSDYVRDVENRKDPGGLAFVKFINGVHGFIKGTSKSPINYMFEIDLLFSDGRLILSDDGREMQVSKFSNDGNSSGLGYKTLKVDSNFININQNERMLEALSDIIRCIESNLPPKSNGSNAIEVHRLIKGIKISSKEKNSKIILSQING